ncbi:hypothetical protein P1P75_41130 [Streptomyces sp. ID05-39B]|uniref:hypothetical protein n=1 Tax=Streptomyces sp. ID05-39B TaxID=3028664 RepID=UPI0029B14833|nr:hypothetical protein [Streptomyces sp. ID05-39B]MDX3532633.1 hypothetical protein [Streptomyces sp. ID05-39B]
MPNLLRTRPHIVAAIALPIVLLLGGCGSEHTNKPQGSASQEETRLVGGEGSASPPAEGSPTPTSSGISKAGNTEAADRAERQRIEAAPPGDVITPSSVTGIPQGGEHFGVPVIQKDDLTVYTPKFRGDTMIIPIKIINSGDSRAYYRFTIRVTGANGYDATTGASMDVVGLYPGTSR